MQNDEESTTTSPPLKKQKLNPAEEEEIDLSKMQDVEYDFEYEDDFEENNSDEKDIIIENEYYIAKGELDKEVSKILFQEIIELKNEK